jgi:adenine-specific DNA-methyltransferase
VPIIQFKGKTAVESYHRVVPHHTLEIDGKLSPAKKPSLDGNLIIEGDNLIALKSLLPTHAGKIKCIYIDPPYNTGNEGWIYNDNLTQPQFKEWIGNAVGKEGEDACRHDKWCCMMYPRLQLLKELLREDGAIFVSIDDNEVHHLRMLMDEVFGEENFVACFCWRRRASSALAEKMVSADHEFVLCYQRTDSFGFFGRLKNYAGYSNPDDDPKGDWTLGDLTVGMNKEQRPNQFYVLVDPKTGQKFQPNPNRVWGYIRETMDKLISEGRVMFPKDLSKRPMMKRYKSNLKSDVNPISTWIGSVSGTKESSNVVELGVGLNSEATKQIQEIFGEAVFMYAKPLSLIESLIESSTGNEDFILDSFAGSGTTAHAVLELNKEDGGNRKFILVQQPFDTKENEKEKFNICEKITAERVRRVIKGYSYKNGGGKTNKVEGLGDEFAYVRVGEKLMGEYRQFGDKLPSYEEVSRYIYFTETSQNFDAKKMDETTGKIGECKNISYYLLYTPDKTESRAGRGVFEKFEGQESAQGDLL